MARQPLVLDDLEVVTMGTAMGFFRRSETQHDWDPVDANQATHVGYYYRSTMNMVPIPTGEHRPCLDQPAPTTGK